jgi:hypothetical protein
MSVESSIEDTTEAIMASLSSHDLSNAEKEEVSRIVSKLLVKTVEKTTKNHMEPRLIVADPSSIWRTSSGRR